MNLFSKALLTAGLVGATTFAVADTAVNQSALAQATTVKQALTMKDDSNVQLKGYMVITGEVDIDYKPSKRVEIDVEQVRF